MVDFLNTIINKQGLKKVNFKDILEQFNFNHKHLLKEAMDQSSGYCFHETGFFPIIGDSIFKGIRFREMEDTIYINLLDENEEYNEIAKNIWLESRKLRDKSLSSAEKDAVKQTIDRLEDELFDIKTHITSNYNGEFIGEEV